MKIAIIGAGMAGLSCAHRLAATGHQAAVFDKGRGAGGRMATRRIETGDAVLRFDHGAQYFTARDEAFTEQVVQWEARGIVAPFPAAGEDAWVGIPGMNAPLKALAKDLDVRFATRIDRISRQDGWHLAGLGLETGYDVVVVATPAEQAAELLANQDSGFAADADATRSEPCWTLLVAFSERLPLADTLRNAGMIGWAARDSAKPGRGGPERWVVQASPSWSRDHLECAAKEVVQHLLDALAGQIAQPLPNPIVATAHRWRYARSGTLGRGCLWSPRRGLGVCGDWLLGPRVENAWLSGTRLADAIGPAR